MDPETQPTADPGGQAGSGDADRGRLRRALRYSFLDGLLTTVTLSLVDTFAIPALISLKAGNLTVAILAGAASLLSGVCQLFSPWLTANATSRRAMVLRGIRSQALACLFLAGAGFLGDWGIPLAISAYCLYSVSGSVIYGTWASWMSDLVPSSGRSRYFALRSMIYGPVGGAATLGTGLAFRMIWGGSDQAPWTAFAAAFALAALLRFGASLFVARQHEPPARGEKTPAEDFSYWQFLSKTGESNFANFTVLFALLNGGAYLTGPFFTAYVMKDLGCDAFTYATFPICAIVSSMFFVRFWARAADRWGNLLVIRVTSVLLALIPLLYLGNGHVRLWPLYIGWVAGGAVWSGLNLASFNLVMETATPRRRVRCFAYMQATVGIVVAGFMLVWGSLADHLPVFFQHQLQTVFLCSVFLRMLPALGMIFLVRDRHPKPEAGALDLFYELPAVRPTADFLRGLVRPFSRS
ncbi:MAG TPA: MFS transporter [Planctomycetota bacterium]|nr:MFS transporter [Planctomycetota bacterium]